MKRKLIYLSSIRLTDKVSRDWYLDYAIEKGVVVEYWDIVSLMREDYEETGVLDVKYLRYLKTYQEFESLVLQPENQNAVYVMLISYSGRFNKPFRILSKYNCKMAFFSWGAMPTTAPESRLQRIIYRLLTDPSDFGKKLFDLILGQTLRKLNFVKRFDIVFVAGSVLTSNDQYAKRVVSINLCDFDHHSRVKLVDARIVEEKYAVFLDVNLPYQSDLEICGLPAVEPISYFKSLNQFFDILELSYGFNVVIAAHPKASYIDNEFQHRKIFRLLTAELVKDAEFVIAHTSTALSYAILSYKPIVFTYTDQMLSIYKRTVIRDIKSVASYFNESVYNIDKVLDGSQIDIKLDDQKLYDNYKYCYLTSSQSENSTSAEIFLREIKSL